jgi:hypothetical protein
LKAGEFGLSRLGPWIREIGGKTRPEKLSDPRKPKLRRNRITSADFWPFWAPGNRIDAKFGVPAEILGLERLTAKFACLQKPATTCIIQLVKETPKLATTYISTQVRCRLMVRSAPLSRPCLAISPPATYHRPTPTIRPSAPTVSTHVRRTQDWP